MAAGICGPIPNLQVKKSSDESCLEIVRIPSFECFEVNNQGGCDVAERIVVIERSKCGATKFVENKFDDGKPCPEGLLAYNGQCEIGGSKPVCNDKGLGKRLLADL